MTQSDLYVKPISDSLEGFDIDVVVSGSIGAVESVRFIRALRRLGGSVHPFLTRGGAQFTTETALTWAANNNVVSEFRGDVPHIAVHDACIIAPASANIIAEVANGSCHSPGAALIQSYLGQSKPVFFLPNMHQSLFDSPIVQENLKKISGYMTSIPPREEEGKLKFPEPALLADIVSHKLNRGRRADGPNVLISMGTTRGYVDDVRYFSNYSSGALGTAISEEAYRQGYITEVVCGPCEIKPRNYSKIKHIQTNEELSSACLESSHNGVAAAVLAASVLDFVPSTKLDGKISSSDDLKVDFKKSEKIISTIHPTSGVKVGFKLESDFSHDEAQRIAKSYTEKYDLSLICINKKADVSSSKHIATLYETSDSGTPKNLGPLETKQEIANKIVSHISDKLGR